MNGSGIEVMTDKTNSIKHWLRPVVAVMWSFFGVRKGAEHEADMQSLKPMQVIVAGVLLAALLVWVLLSIVHWVVASSA